MSRLNVDHVLVERVISGDFALAAKANKDDRAEIIRQWAGLGRSLTDLARRAHWKVTRADLEAVS